MTSGGRVDLRGSDLRRLPWKLRYERGAMAASAFRQLAIKATHSHCTVEFRGPAYLGPGFSLMIPDHGSLIVGAGVSFRRGFVCEISESGRVEIGANTVFTSHALIQCTTSILIEEDCVFGQAAMIVDGSHRFRDRDVPMLQQGYDFRPIRIGRGASVMAKCTVIASIGDRAFIGAGSSVTRDIPAYCLAVGSPARVIDYYGPPGAGPEISP
jgi:acetyltransferase-like isoleucine patch superfamily enzyme